MGKTVSRLTALGLDQEISSLRELPDAAW